MNAVEDIQQSSGRPDLYIALVGAAGTNLQPVKNELKAQLASFSYGYQEIKLSRLIADFCEIDVTGRSEDQRITALMDGGDRIRQAHGGGDGVVCLAVANIQSIREKGQEPTTKLLGSTAFVIDSLKNPEEIKTLNKLYGKNFYTISVYESESARVTKLANRIAETLHTPTRDEHRTAALDLIKEDERRDATKLSQDVLNTFPKADFFVTNDDIEVHIKRFIGLLFGEPFTTPTVDEYAMFIAKAASLRSCDLSRQVGAVITEKAGAIISSGYNDVPYPTGGVWYEGREGEDNRDHVVEYDPNSSEIANILLELVRAFRKAQLIQLSHDEMDDDAIVQSLLHGEWKTYTIDARIRNLIEFGRVVHAEMHAISEAAKLGRSVAGGTLYCTTFPCHICARHIIASGVREVVYIEPYPKSLTKSLYEREISTDDSLGVLPEPVLFRPFQGVSPVLFQRMFSFRPRKSEWGTVVKFNHSTAVPVGAVYGVANMLLEDTLSERIDEIRNILSVANSTSGAGRGG